MPELLGLRLDRLDAVVDVEDLATAVELAQDRVAHQAGARLRDPRLDRQAVLGRGLDHRHVADAREREVERPRDRRGAQGQDVDLALELLEPLLRRNAEPLLLVDDDEPEVLEPDVLGQQPMGADDEVDRPGGKASHGRLLLGLRDEAREQLDGDREGAEPGRERRVVLRREDGRGNQDRDLLRVLDRLEGGPDRDLGLAIPDVADDEAVHRANRLHVVLDLDGGAELVDRLLVRERGLHLGLPGAVAGVWMTRGRGPSRVQREQLLGEVADRLPDALLRPEPLGAAELRERRVLAAGVARDPPDLLDRDEDPVLALERELEEVTLVARAGAAPEHPLVAGDAVVDVDHEVAGA